MDDKHCIVGDCDSPRYGRKDMCRRHYGAMQRNGTLERQPMGPKPKPPRVCLVDDCDGPHKGYGYCRMHLDREQAAGRLIESRTICAYVDCPRPIKAHYLCASHARQRSNGRPLGPIRECNRQPATCTGPECNRPTVAKGFCPAHYSQVGQGRPLTPIREPVPEGTRCASRHCDRLAEKADMCGTHRRRFLRGEEGWDRPIAPKAPDGTGFVNHQGYRVISVSGKRRFEHRHLAEQLLGRPLLPTEDVHHVSTDRLDNSTDGPFRQDERGRLRSGNLEVWAHSHPRGGEIGPQFDAALAFLSTYAKYVTGEQEETLRGLCGRA